jgi:anaphase-promoting complex subunit 4
LGPRCSPQIYAVYGFDEAQIDQCLSLLHKAIVLSAWLASTAREQLWRFKEFKLWLQYGISPPSSTLSARKLTPPPESNKVHTDDGKIRIMSWDVLEVNRYLMDGLNGCDLHKWFDGDEGDNRVPTMTPDDLRAPPPNKTLAAVMEEAKNAVDDPTRLSWEFVE